MTAFCSFHQNKRVIPTRQRAEQVAERLSHRRPTTRKRGVLHAYFCALTGGWHVGHEEAK